MLLGVWLMKNYMSNIYGWIKNNIENYYINKQTMKEEILDERLINDKF